MTIRKRSRLFATGAVLASAALVLTACGSTDDADTADTGTGDSTSDTGDAPAGDDVTMVTVPKLTGISWFNRMEQGVNMYAEDTGYNAYYQGSSEADAAAQVRVLEDLIASDVDAINVTPFQPDAVEQTLKRALDADIVVITHEAPGIENATYDLEAFQRQHLVNYVDAVHAARDH